MMSKYKYSIEFLDAFLKELQELILSDIKWSLLLSLSFVK